MFKENTLVNKVLFFILLVLCLTPFISIPVALFMGLAFALVFKNPYPDISKKASKYLLQFSVVGLGFGMNMYEALKAGKEGITFTIVSVFGVLLIGVFLGKLFKLERTIAYLISAGTAICGGSLHPECHRLIYFSDTGPSLWSLPDTIRDVGGDCHP